MITARQQRPDTDYLILADSTWCKGIVAYMWKYETKRHSSFQLKKKTCAFPHTVQNK